MIIMIITFIIVRLNVYDKNALNDLDYDLKCEDKE